MVTHFVERRTDLWPAAARKETPPFDAICHDVRLGTNVLGALLLHGIVFVSPSDAVSNATWTVEAVLAVGYLSIGASAIGYDAEALGAGRAVTARKDLVD